MIISGRRTPSTSRWLQACVLALAALVIPCGVTYSQDHDAVARRLKAAVKAGELTGKQAEAMLQTLKKTAAATKAHPKKGTVKGKKDIDPKVAALKKAAASKKAAPKKGAAKDKAGKKGVDYEAAGAKIKAAVKAGKLTEEEARARWAALKKTAAARKAPAKKGPARAKKDIDYKAAAAKLKAAVKAGKLTEKEARAKWAAIQKAADRDGK